MEELTTGLAPPATKKCPFCGEEILSIAIKCKHCKSAFGGGAGASAVAAPAPGIAVVSAPAPSSPATAPAGVAPVFHARGPAAPAAAVVLKETSPGAFILLSVITLGIYGLVKFYRVGTSYQTLVGRPSSFVPFFWIYVVAGPTATIILSMVTGVMGVVAYAGTMLVGVLLLLEVLSLRAELVTQRRLNVALTGKAAQAILWVCGAIPFVGLVTVIVEVVFFWQDHNKVAAAMRPVALK